MNHINIRNIYISCMWAKEIQISQNEVFFKIQSLCQLDIFLSMFYSLSSLRLNTYISWLISLCSSFVSISAWGKNHVAGRLYFPQEEPKTMRQRWLSIGGKKEKGIFHQSSIFRQILSVFWISAFLICFLISIRYFISVQEEQTASFFSTEQKQKMKVKYYTETA